MLWFKGVQRPLIVLKRMLHVALLLISLLITFATIVDVAAVDSRSAGGFAVASDSSSRMITLGNGANCTLEENQLELNVTLSIDKPSYRVGDLVNVNVTTNKPALVTMNISSPSRNETGAYSIFQKPYMHVQSLTASSAGKWSIELRATSLCPRSETAKLSETHFDVKSPATYAVSISITGPPGVALTEDGKTIDLVMLQNKTLSFTEGTSHVVSVPRTIDGGEGVRYICENNFVTINSTGSWAFSYVKQYRLKIATDPLGISSELNQELWFRDGSDATLPAPPATISSSDTRIRYVFVGWAIDENQPGKLLQSIKADKPHMATARYKAQYQLIVSSLGGWGNPQGGGFYDSGSTANFSVTSPVGFLIQQVFVEWKGDYVGSSTQGFVRMDGPKEVTAVWQTSYAQVIIMWVLGCVVVASGYFWKKGKLSLSTIKLWLSTAKQLLLSKAKAQAPRPIAELVLPQWYHLGSISDTGKMRRNNEDGILVLETLSSFESQTRSTILCAVADGVGGSEKGEVASKLTLETLGRQVTGSVLSDPNKDRADLLESAIKRTNETVLRYAEQHPESVGMASTIVTAFIDGNKAIIAHVGDSRAYLVSKETIRRLTRDHSQVQEYVDAGKITPEEAKTYPGRNVITRAIGVSPELEVDMSRDVAIPSGDILLLCSDGLWDLVSDEEIRDLLNSTIEPQEACKNLVAMANERGGKDNISVIVVRTSQTSRRVQN